MVHRQAAARLLRRKIDNDLARVVAALADVWPSVAHVGLSFSGHLAASIQRVSVPGSRWIDVLGGATEGQAAGSLSNAETDATQGATKKRHQPPEPIAFDWRPGRTLPFLLDSNARSSGRTSRRPGTAAAVLDALCVMSLHAPALAPRPGDQCCCRSLRPGLGSGRYYRRQTGGRRHVRTRPPRCD